jgi:hypothetical protein
VDKDWVRDLGTRVETETFAGRTLKVFFDEWEIGPGTNVVKKMEDGVSKARFVGVVLSPEMLDAEWPTMEWTMAVYEDPSGRKGKVLPILRRNCDIPPSLRIRNLLDFRKPERYEREYSRLLAVLRNEPLPRGRRSKGVTVPFVGSPEYFAKPLEFADRVPEQLASNLFPVKNYPATVWKAETDVHSIGQVYSHLGKFTTAETLPTFILKQNHLYCFWDLNDKFCPFRGLVTNAASIREEDSKSWMVDEVKQNWLLELLNRALWNTCDNLGLYRDREHSRIYFLPENGHDRVVEWDTGRRKSRRTVVKQYPRGEQGNVFWAHLSAILRFTAIDDRLFLRIEPSWTFTEDGANPLRQERMSSISTRWMYDEYNPSIFYHLRFWTFILSEGKKKMVLDSGKSAVEVETTPATADIGYGIDGDYFSIDKMYEVAETETPPVDLLIQAEEE